MRYGYLYLINSLQFLLALLQVILLTNFLNDLFLSFVSQFGSTMLLILLRNNDPLNLSIFSELIIGPICDIIGLLTHNGQIIFSFALLDHNIISRLNHRSSKQINFITQLKVSSLALLVLSFTFLIIACVINLFILMKTELIFKNISRVSYNQEILNLQGELRSLSIQVQAPVLNEYNYINLKSKKNRIDHHAINDFPLLNKSRSHDSTQRDKWEKSLDRYILAKQKLQTRKASISGEFQFLKLDKINKYRKKKLVEASSLPISIINSTDLHQNYSFDLSETYSEFKHSMKLKERARRRFNTEKDASHLQTPKQNLASPKETSKTSNKNQQQRIMNNLLQNYFRKKYSQQLSKLSPKIKINKFSSAILRKNKKRIVP